MLEALIPWPNEGGFVVPADGDIPEFRDCLWLTPDEAATLTDAEKQAMAEQRYANYVTAIRPAVPPPAPSITEQIADIERQQRDLERQRLDLLDQAAAQSEQ